jgi:hypothetical protein
VSASPCLCGYLLTTLLLPVHLWYQEDVPFGTFLSTMRLTRWTISEPRATTLAAAVPNLNHCNY